MKALITGSNGFIGSRLVARLTQRGDSVRALVRRTLGLRRNGEGLIEYVRGDVTDAERLPAAASGCDVVYHCAWGGSTLDEQRLVNVEGTRNIIKAAAAAGVRKVVHLSSVAVHGQKLPGVLTEAFPVINDGDPYSVSKAEGERAAFELGARTGTAVVSLRPTLVYGPGAPLWVVAYLERVKDERVLLLDGGRGLANLVHVDDVVDTMLAAADRDGVAGEAFLVNGYTISWREYLGYFASMCRKPLPRSMPSWRARALFPIGKAFTLLANQPPRVLSTDVQLMTQHCTVSIEKARRQLGYEPKVTMVEGMAQCEAWLRREGYLPPATITDRAMRVKSSGTELRTPSAGASDAAP